VLKLALKGVLAHKVRLAMTAVAIVLGVAFVSGTYVFTDSITRSFEQLFRDANAGVDLVVQGVSDFGTTVPRIDEGILANVKAVPGVEVAAPSVSGSAQIVAPAPCEKGPGADPAKPCPIGGNGPPTLGFSYVPEGVGLTTFNLTEGDWPAAADDVLVNAHTAEAGHLAVGDVVDVITPAGVEPFHISGIASFGEDDSLMGATLAVFGFDTAQRIFDSEGQISSISVVLDPLLDPTVVQAQISSFLPDGVEVITGADQTENNLDEFASGIGFINTILLVIAGVAVFVGAFLIQNTFRIIVAQRTRELAMLRAIGATARQTTTMVILEALFVGVVASAIGIGVGVLIAFGLKSAFGAFGFGLPATALVIAPRTIIVGFVVGIVVTLGSTLVPARKAAQVPPIAALRDVDTPPRSLGRRIAVGVGVTGLGLLMLLVGLFVTFDNALSVVGLGALVTFVGVSLVAPLIARGFARWVGGPMARTGVAGRLAQENAMRRPRRTASTASALMIGVALVSVIAVFSASAKAGVADVFREQFSTDFQVRLTGFSDPTAAGLPPALGAALRTLPEVSVVVTDRFGDFRFAGDTEAGFLLAVDGPYDQVVHIDMVAGSPADLGPGDALVGRADSERLGIRVGDTVTIQFASLVTADLRVVGIYEDTAIGLPLVIDYTTYEQHIAFRLDRFVYVKTAAGVDLEQARVAITAVTDAYPSAAVTDTEELIGDLESQIDGLLNLLVVLLAFAIIIALLGIVNTLALSISERKREIGLLRAVGMQRRQVRRMVRWEAVLIALFGGVLGLAVGLALGIALVVAVGEGLRLTIPGGQLFTYLIAAGLGGVLAAAIPARRGAKLDILDAIAYE